MKKIELTKGHVALVDDEDFDRVNQFKWYSSFNGRSSYAKRRPWDKKEKKYFTLAMHRFIMKPEKDQLIDHINHNTLDNRKCNLRICNMTQNCANSLKPKGITSSKFKGVSWCKRDKKWICGIMINYKKIYLGRYDSEVESAQIYNNKAKELFGEFASLN